MGDRRGAARGDEEKVASASDTRRSAAASGEKWRGDGNCKEMVVAAKRQWRWRGDGGGGNGSGDDDDGDLEGLDEDDVEEFINVS